MNRRKVATYTAVGLGAVILASGVGPSSAVGSTSRVGSSLSVEHRAVTDHPRLTHLRIWREAQTVVRREHVTIPWDGRYQVHYVYDDDYRLCLETFNGTPNDIMFRGHGLPGGFYLLICSNGRFSVHDAVPFSHLRTY